LQSHIYLLSFTDEIAGIPALEMLIADPLFQIAPNCLLVGQAAKDRLAKAEARYDDERGGYPASVHFDEGNQPDQHRYRGNDKSRQLSLIPHALF
jgi:hypothetical protein